MAKDEPDILLPEECKVDKCPDSKYTGELLLWSKGLSCEIVVKTPKHTKTFKSVQVKFKASVKDQRKFSSKAAHGSSLPASTACSASGFLDNPNGSERCKESWNQACKMPQT